MSDSSVNNSTPRFDDVEVRNDGALINALTGMGVRGKDSSMSTYSAQPRQLAQVELEALYYAAIPRRYVDALPEEMLRHIPTITLGGEDPEENQNKINAFEEELKYTNWPSALCEVMKLQRLYGGAGIVMLVDDGLPPEEEININKIRAIKGFVPLSRYELIPSEVTITDWRKPNHYLITTSQRLNPEQTDQYSNIKIHASRVARFDGLHLAWPQRSANTGWGLSVLQLIWDAYRRYEVALNGMEELGKQASLFVHSMPGLFQRIANGNESDLRKRLEANSLSRSIYGGIVVDNEENVEWLNNGLGGLAGATDPFIKDLQAATGWPESILMGTSPGGMGKEGRFEERVWASIVEKWQENYCREPISQMFTLMMAAREGPFKGKVPESWKVYFPSVFTQTDAEKVDIRMKAGQLDQIYVNLGILAPTEVRTSRFDGPEYSFETELNEDITEKMTVQADLAFESQLQNYQAQQAMQQQQAALGQAAMGGNDPAASAKQPGAPTPNGLGDAPSSTDGAPQATPPEGDSEGGIVLPDEVKKDSLDFYEAQGLRIRVTSIVGESKIGYLCMPDGQRVDTATPDSPLMIFGPNRTRAYKLYRSRFECDGLLHDGPYVTGFARMKTAKHAVSEFFPSQNMVGLSPINDAEAESLRAGWEAY